MSSGSSSRNVALTTIDNPFDPIDDFDRWLSADMQLAVSNGRRDTCSMLALFAKTSPNFSDSKNSKEIEKAIDEIVENDFVGIFRKIVKV